MSTLAPRPIQQQTVTQMVAALFSVPRLDRARVARQQLSQTHPALVRAFESIPREQLPKTILFVSVNPHSRETRFATAARLAGWNPVLVHTSETKYAPDSFFSFAARLDNLLQLVAACWLFPGALVHCFVLRGDHAHLLALTKGRPLILDLYDTGSGMKVVSPQCHQAERETIPLADAITHRDLRIKYLHKIHGYSLPRHNLFVHDPLPDVKPRLRTKWNDGEIHVVSVGWVGPGDSSILRVAKALCSNRVHLHIYFNPFQDGNVEAEAYRQLQNESGYLHIEKPAYGEEYWSELANYDFGLSVFEPHIYDEPIRDYTDDYIRGCGSSRISDYISMNLGVIVTPGLRFQKFWASRFATVVVPGTREFFDNPQPVLEAALRAKTIKDRSSISVQGLASRLGNFYTRVATRRKEARALRGSVQRKLSHFGKR